MKDNRHIDLLYLAKSSVDYKARFSSLNEVIKLLNKVEDFTSSHQRIIPLLRRKAYSLDIFSRLSKQTQKTFSTENNKAVVNEILKREQLNLVINTFKSHNIPIILLKGIAFSYTLYSHSSPRGSNDIDILVKAKDWELARELISKIMLPLHSTKSHVFDDLYETTFIPKKNIGAVLDLHKALIHPILFDIDESDIWENSCELEFFKSENVRVLSPEHTLLHQAIHAYKDMDFNKYNLVDTYEVINFYRLNFDKTNLIAKNWGAAAPLYFLLSNCNKVMDLNIEPRILNNLSPTFWLKYIAYKLLESEHSKLISKNKSLRYRVNQLISQFVFTQSVIKPLRFQWLYLKTAVKQIKVK